MKNRNGLFSGWKDVYAFTFKQAVSIKSFKIVTIAIMLALFVGTASINVISAMNNKKEKPAELTMENVVFYDETGILVDNGIVLSNDDGEEITGINYEIVDVKSVDVQKAFEKCIEKEKSVMVHVYEEDEYVIEMLMPENCGVSKASGKELLKKIKNYFVISKILSTGEDMDVLVKIVTPVSVSSSMAGEDEDTIGEMIIKMALPMVFSLFLYMMLLIYGQSICKNVISEKVSKLMETMLTSVKPYAIITGKVFGMCSVAIIQFVAWVFATVLGFFTGNEIAKLINPDYKNIVVEAIKFVREDAKNAFSVSSIIMFVILCCMGFVMYSVFAALVSAGVKRAEELNGPLGIYNIIVIIGFFMSYFLGMTVNGGKLEFINFIPPVAVFKLPIDVLLSKVNLFIVSVGSALIVLFTMAIIIATGKIYKKKVF